MNNPIEFPFFNYLEDLLPSYFIARISFFFCFKDMSCQTCDVWFIAFWIKSYLGCCSIHMHDPVCVACIDKMIKICCCSSVNSAADHCILGKDTLWPRSSGSPISFMSSLSSRCSSQNCFECHWFIPWSFQTLLPRERLCHRHQCWLATAWRRPCLEHKESESCRYSGHADTHKP